MIRDRMPTLSSAAVLAVLTLVPVAYAADAPGRYAMQPTEGGFYRLDTQTGAVSICRQKPGAGLVCEPAQDEQGLQKDVERLRAENKTLKEDVKRLEEIAGFGAKPPAGKSGPASDFKLPSEEDVDKALSYVERMIKKFRDKFRDLEGGEPKKGTPL